MARKRGTMWRSRRSNRAKQAWFADSAYGITAPTTGIADADAVLAGIDYSLSAGGHEKVRVKRIILDFWYTPVNPTSAGAASFIIDVALVVMSADDMQAAVTSSVRAVDFTLLDARIIRAKTFPFTEIGQNTSVGTFAPRSPVKLSWNIRTNILLKEPQAIYVYQLNTAIDVPASPEAYEYGYNCRTLFER